jgi:hypothetical protein
MLFEQTQKFWKMPNILKQQLPNLNEEEIQILLSALSGQFNLAVKKKEL